MKFPTLAVSFSLSLFSAAAVAGLAQGPAADLVVTANGDGSGEASGSMVHARFSDNDVEYIGCGTRVQLIGATVDERGFCQAQDSNEVQIACNTTNPALLTTIRSISDYSYITFSVDPGGYCTRIGVSTQSFYIPDYAEKKAKKKGTK